MMKVIVYGGCGGLGRQIVEYLKGEGFWVLSGMSFYKMLKCFLFYQSFFCRARP